MEITQDPTKKIKHSIEMQARADQATRDIGILNTDKYIAAQKRKIYEVASEVFAICEDLEAAGIDHSDAMMIAVLLENRK